MSAWIIQDGNYGDFAINHRAEFAGEFHPAEPPVRSDSGPLAIDIHPALSHLGANR